MPQSVGVVCYTAIDNWSRYDVKKKMSEISFRAIFVKSLFQSQGAWITFWKQWRMIEGSTKMTEYGTWICKFTL